MFHMTSDTRARTCAKLLKTELAAFNKPVTLKASQDLVSRMYGYEGWRDLINRLGDEQSPDDHLVSDDERSARFATQLSVLAGEAGLVDETAKLIISRLGLTGSTHEQAERAVSLIDYTDALHPLRFMTGVAKGAMFGQLTSAAASSAKALSREIGGLGMDDYHVPFDNLTDWDAADFTAAAEIVIATHRGGIILDIEGSLGEVKAGPEVALPLSVKPEMDRPIYVHFGPNAYPSPFFGCGIEGAYVQLQAGADPIKVYFVVSQDAADMREPISEVFSGRQEVSLVQNCRIFGYSVAAGDIASARCFLGSNRGGAEMTRYISDPLKTALQAMDQLDKGLLPVELSVASEFVADDILPKVRRARTEAEIAKLEIQLPDLQECHLVRFMGSGSDVDSENEWLWKIPADISVDDLSDMANASFNLASESYLPAVRGYYGERIVMLGTRLAKLVQPSEVVRNSAVIGMGYAYLSDAAAYSGDFAKAFAYMHGSTNASSSWDKLARAAALAIAANDRSRVEGFLYVGGDDSALSSWARAMSFAWLGKKAEAKVELKKAKRMNPHVLDFAKSRAEPRNDVWLMPRRDRKEEAFFIAEFLRFGLAKVDLASL